MAPRDKERQGHMAEQDIQRSDRFSLTSLTRKSGLPSSQIHALCQGLDRVIWMATPAGLASYNGAHVRSWGRKSGLASHGIRSLACDRTGLIWIGSDGGLDAFDQHAHLVDWNSTVAWPFGLVDRIQVLADDSLLLAVAHGLVHLRARPGFPFEVLAHIDLGLVVDIGALSNGVWACALASNELVLVEDGDVTRVRHPALQELGLFSALEVAGPDALLVCGRAGLLLLDLAQESVRWLVRDQAVEVARLAGDQVWFGAGDSLQCAALDGDGRPQIQLDRCRVNDIHIDALDNVWVATDNMGLHKLSGLRDLVRHDPVYGSRPVYCIRPAREGYFVAGDSRLIWQRQAASQSYPIGDLTVWDVLEDPRDAGKLWIATQQGLFCQRDGQAPAPQWPRHRVLGSPGRCLLYCDDAIWVGTLAGLCRIHDGQVEDIMPPDGSALGYVYTLQLDPNGGFWAGTLGRGLWHCAGGQLQAQAIGGAATPNVYAIATTAAGQLLVAQDDVLWCREGEGDFVPVYTARDAVAAWSLSGFGADQVLLGTTTGLMLLQLPGGQSLCQINGLGDGPDWEFTTSRSLWLDEAGVVHGGINAGHVAVKLAALQRRVQPPDCQLARCRWDQVEPRLENGSYRVRPGRWSLRLDVSSAWFVDERALQYRFKLSGFEADWSEFDDDRSARYSSLPPGRYELLAQATSPLAGAGPMRSLVRIEVEEKAALIAAAVRLLDRLDEGIARLRQRRRNARLLGQTQAMQEEVASQTRALQAANAELKQTVDQLQVMSNSDALTGIGNRRLFDQVLEREIIRCRRQQRPLALALIDVDFFKKYNDHYGHQAGDDCLRRMGSILRAQVRSPPDVPARYGGEEFAVIMPELDAAQAQQAAQRLRAAVEDSAIEHQGNEAGGGRVTISIGVAVAVPAQALDPAQLLAAADQALYQAKHRGRNRVEVSGPEAAPDPA